MHINHEIDDAIQSPSGGALFFELRKPDKSQGTPIGTVVVVHGLGEHQERYVHIAELLLEKGYQVLTYDHKGHGRSTGKRGHIQDFKEYTDDLHAVIKKAQSFHPDIPIFLLGHSMGALVALMYLHNYHNITPVQSVVLIGIPVKPVVEISPVKEILSMICAVVAPKAAFSIGLDSRFLSRNEEVGIAYDNDPLVLKKVTAGWYNAFQRAEAEVMNGLNAIATPALFLHGSDDRIAHPDGSRAVFQKYPSEQKQLHIYEGCYHELLNEDCHPGIVDEIHHWYQQSMEGLSQQPKVKEMV